MSCSDIRAILEDYVDGLVAAPVAERVRDHLDRCEACRLDVDASRAASLSMASWGDLEPPADCFDKILARIEALPPDALEPVPAPPKASWRGRGLGWWAVTATAVAATFLVGINLSDSLDPVTTDALYTAIPSVPLTRDLVSNTGPPSTSNATDTLRPGEELIRPVAPGEEEWIVDDRGVRRRVVFPVVDDGGNFDDGGSGGVPAMPVEFGPRRFNPR